MGAVLVVIRDIRREQAPQVRLIDGDHVIQQFAAAAANPPLRDSILPGATDCCVHRPHLHGANSSGHLSTVFAVVIEEEKPGCRFVGKGFAQLLHDPGGSRMASNVAVQNAPPIVGNEEEAVEYAEGDGGDMSSAP